LFSVAIMMVLIKLNYLIIIVQKYNVFFFI
jgi:hypothetical protein